MLNKTNIVTLNDLYEDHIRFVDPVHEINGLDCLICYFDNMIKNTTECRFEFLDQCIAADKAYFKWKMYYAHPKISSARQCLKGVTHIEFNKKIFFHEDIYDLGAMVYEHLPVIGKVTKVVKNRLSQY